MEVSPLHLVILSGTFIMKCTPSSPEAYQLFHEGILALSQVEANGIVIDKRQLKKNIKFLDGEIKKLTEELRGSKVFKLWRKTFGAKTNLGSNPQLGTILFEKMGVPCNHYTKKGKPSTKAEVMDSIDHPFVKTRAKIEQYKKCKNTFLKGILRETTSDGYLHPSFNLHIARSLRSSSDNPNFQNFPVRNKELSKLVRTVFVSRYNHRLVEIDYSGIEVFVAYCYHKDPRMKKYLLDPSKDMHRDMAAACYLCEPEQVSKDMRYCGKNKFVFPQFYGDYYKNCAQALWDSISLMDLRLEGGKRKLETHLKKQGIKRRGKCEHGEDHASGTFEKEFWTKRLSKYNSWKEHW